MYMCINAVRLWMCINYCPTTKKHIEKVFKYSNLRCLLRSFYYLLKSTIIFKRSASLIYIKSSFSGYLQLGGGCPEIIFAFYSIVAF